MGLSALPFPLAADRGVGVDPICSCPRLPKEWCEGCGGCVVCGQCREPVAALARIGGPAAVGG